MNFGRYTFASSKQNKSFTSKRFKNMANQITPAEALQAFTLFLSFREALEKTDINFNAEFTHANGAVTIEFKICDVAFNATYRNDADYFASQLNDYCEDICEPIQNEWHNERASKLMSEYWPTLINVEYDSDKEEYVFSDNYDEDEHGNLENDVTKLNMSRGEIQERFIDIFCKFELE